MNWPLRARRWRLLCEGLQGVLEVSELDEERSSAAWTHHWMGMPGKYLVELNILWLVFLDVEGEVGGLWHYREHDEVRGMWGEFMGHTR